MGNSESLGLLPDKYIPLPSSEQSMKVNATFIPEVRKLESLLQNPESNWIEEIDKRYTSFVHIEGGSARSFFIVGFLLVQESLLQDSIDSKNSKSTKYLANSFVTLMLCTKSSQQRDNLLILEKKLNTFLHEARRETQAQFFGLAEKPTIATLISQKCNADKNLSHAIIEVGRGSILKKLKLEQSNPQVADLTNKFSADKGWWDAFRDFTDILRTFCDFFNFKVIVHTIKDDQMEENTIGNDDAEHGAHVFKYSSGIKDFEGILYQKLDTLNFTLDLSGNGPEEMKMNGSFPPEGRKYYQPYIYDEKKTEIMTDDYKICDICMQETLEHLVFTNKPCTHNYCQHCIGESYHVSSDRCIVKGCPAMVSQIKLKEFMDYRNRGEKSIMKSVGCILDENIMNITNDSLKEKPQDEFLSELKEDVDHFLMKDACSVCSKPNSKQNPALAGQNCNHNICFDCLIKHRPVFGPSCFMEKCEGFISFERYKGFAQMFVPQYKFKAQCYKCLDEVESTKMYLNPTCEHILCSKCTGELTNTQCPISNCQEEIDEDKLLAFTLDILKEQDQSEDKKYLHSQQQRNKLSAALSSEMECSICLDHIYQCVTVIPCLHNFCAACFSDYMHKFKVCPTCQEELYLVKKNAIMNNIIQKFLEENPEKKRPKEEYESMNTRDQIRQEVIKF